MTNPTIPQRVLFPELVGKPVVATFDREQASSDGGAVLLKAAERVYDLVKGFARCLVDKRAPERIRHTLEDLIGQRVFGIACGHPDGNDADHLAEDPIHKLLLGRDPVTGERLASQPTLSRFENGVGPGALYRMARELAESVIERHRRRRQGRARRITIDLDPTDDPTHGAQQLTFFNGFYDTWCYQPVAKVGLGLDGSNCAFYTAWHGDGQETGGAAGVTDVGKHRGPSDERRTSFLRAAEPGPGRIRV